MSGFYLGVHVYQHFPHYGELEAKNNNTSTADLALQESMEGKLDVPKQLLKIVQGETIDCFAMQRSWNKPGGSLCA